MTDEPDSQPVEPQTEHGAPRISSLKELIERVTGRSSAGNEPTGDAGYAEPLPYPFLALVGQVEMKLALLLALINPHIGGILLIGPRGTGKTTAVRSLLDLLPEIRRPLCFYGCLEEDIEQGGMDAVCPDCARRYGEGLPLTSAGQVQLVELPLNASLEDVIGGLDEHAQVHERMRLKRGLLSRADQNILYVDEANLLADDIVDAILDAAAQGNYTVRRGLVSASYRSRFTLIGTMNPEEGKLRPQIMDRFGLRVLVRGLSDPAERLEAYRRVREYARSPRQAIAHYWEETDTARREIQAARTLLPQVILPDAIARLGIELIQALQIDSLRADITLFETARAYAAADSRSTVSADDLFHVAPIALRLRRSTFIEEYLTQRKIEEEEILEQIKRLA